MVKIWYEENFGGGGEKKKQNAGWQLVSVNGIGIAWADLRRLLSGGFACRLSARNSNPPQRQLTPWLVVLPDLFVVIDQIESLVEYILESLHLFVSCGSAMRGSSRRRTQVW